MVTKVRGVVLPFAVVLFVGCGSGTSDSLFGSSGSGGSASGGAGGSSTLGGPGGPDARAGLGGSVQSCSRGTTAECECTGQHTGRQTCEPNGAFSVCVCDGGIPATVTPKPDGATQADCQPGHFKGTLTGTYQTASTLLPATLPLNLNLDVLLSPSNRPGFLTLDGSGSGFYLVVPYAGHITGLVECDSGVVTDGLLVGSYGNGAPGGNSFQGPVTGEWDHPSGVISGAWDAHEQNPTYGGTGTWRATLQP